MRKLIVNNFFTLDGYYEGKDKSIGYFFDCYHEDHLGGGHFREAGDHHLFVSPFSQVAFSASALTTHSRKLGKLD